MGKHPIHSRSLPARLSRQERAGLITVWMSPFASSGRLSPLLRRAEKSQIRLSFPAGGDQSQSLPSAPYTSGPAESGLQATLPLDALLAGARLTLDGTLAGSRLRDPVTDRPRLMDDVPSRKLTADLRHDVPQLKSSWGLTYAVAVRGEVFFTAERLSWRDDAIWGAYVETTALSGFKTTLKATAINGLDFHRRRRFFDLDRVGAYLGEERREQRLGATFSLTLAKAF